MGKRGRRGEERAGEKRTVEETRGQERRKGYPLNTRLQGPSSSRILPINPLPYFNCFELTFSLSVATRRIKTST